jgi:hypothetical protein
VDELSYHKISPVFSSSAGICRRSAPFHTTMAKKKGKKQQQELTAPAKNLEPLIEEGFT